jgi:hypothetical protein
VVKFVYILISCCNKYQQYTTCYGKRRSVLLQPHVSARLDLHQWRRLNPNCKLGKWVWITSGMIIYEGKQGSGKQPESKFVCQPCLLLVCIFLVYIRGIQAFQNPRGQLKIVVAPKGELKQVPPSRWKILSINVQNLFGRTNWRPGFVHLWSV